MESLLLGLDLYFSGIIHVCSRTATAIRIYGKGAHTAYSMKAAERFFHMGNEELMRGNPSKAISLYNRSLRKAPGNPSVLMNKAGALMDMRIYGEALETIEEAIEVAPDIAKCWGMRGDILGMLGNYVEALRSCDRAIELDPYDPRLPEYRDQVRRMAGMR